MNWKTLLLGTGTISRTAYLTWGLSLALVKYNLDRVAVGAVGEGRWTLLNPEVLHAYLFQVLPAAERTAAFATVLALSLPFIWFGVMLTVARLRAAGLRPWLAILFFVPAIKLVLFALLCVLPDRTQPVAPLLPGTGSSRLLRWLPRGFFACAVVSATITASVGVVMTTISTLLLKDYGWSLFVATPFVVGFLATLLCGLAQGELSFARAMAVMAMANAVAGVVFLLLAIEGAFCLVMAAPIALVLGGLGALVGLAALRVIRPQDHGGLYCAAVLAVPLLMAGEHVAEVPAPLLRVSTAVVVEAPPERVWPNVVTFSELPPPREWLFRAGIAYPIRARIEGRGAGAIRHCEFTTGPFVEPIEVWNEPRLLKFRVTANPEPMQEWTPYREIHPPHLEGFLVSRQGQFRLEPLPGGRTLLEGTTWYHHHLWPAAYWQVWSDWIIHSIHGRVLQHVKHLSENPTPPRP